MKTFFLFAVISFADPSAPRGISCVDFFEPDNISYKSKSKCYAAAERTGNTLHDLYEEKHGRILELIVWCVTPRGNPI